MSVRSVDRNPDHLFGIFRERLFEVLEEAERVIGQPFLLVEGYRSAERQLYLYGQGRPHVRPYGRKGNIVTWTRKPTRHGSAMAADVLPKQTGYRTPYSTWLKLRAVYQRRGLEGSAWAQGDYGHIQWPLTDTANYEKARKWVRDGFKGAPAPPQPVEVRVVFEGDEIEDADAFLRNRAVIVALRPLCDAADWIITQVKHESAHVVQDEVEFDIAVEKRYGRSFVPLRALAREMGLSLDWNQGEKRVTLARR
jgi:copper amine oxidase-like protein